MGDIRLGEAFYNVELKGVDKALKNADRKMKSAGDSLGDSFSSSFSLSVLDGVRLAIGDRLVSAFQSAGRALVDFTKQSVELAGELEQQEVAFTTILGSADKAQTLLSQLKVLALESPFELRGIRQQAKQLLAVGVAMEDIPDTLTRLGDIAGGLSVPLSRIALNFGQVQAQGKLTGRELRDFAVAGLNLREVLAENLNITIGELEERISDGLVTFEDFNEAIKSLTSEGGRFFNIGKNQVDTYRGAVNQFQDALNNLKTNVGRAITPVLQRLFENLTDLTIGAGEFVGAFVESEQFSTILDGVSDSIDGLFDSIKRTGFGELLQKFSEPISSEEKNKALTNFADGILKTARSIKDLAVSTSQSLRSIADSIGEIIESIRTFIGWIDTLIQKIGALGAAVNSVSFGRFGGELLDIQLPGLPNIPQTAQPIVQPGTTPFVPQQVTPQNIFGNQTASAQTNIGTINNFNTINPLSQYAF